MKLPGIYYQQRLCGQGRTEVQRPGCQPEETLARNVENLPALALLVALELLPNHANHDLVADQAASVHDLLGLDTERSLLGNLRSQHVTGGLRALGKNG